MARFGSVVLGAGLVVLWIVGLNQGATMWLTWLLGLAGLTSIVLASMLPAEHGREGAKPPALAGFVLFAVWILAVASRATAWLTWWTFALGVAHLVIAALEVRQPALRLRRRPTF
jgi:hypothetical protein